MAVHTATFKLSFDDPATARVLHDAVAIETDEGPEGTETRLQVDGAAIHVTVDADDVSGLRAAVHGALRLLDAAQRTVAGKD